MDLVDKVNAAEMLLKDLEFKLQELESTMAERWKVWEADCIRGGVNSKQIEILPENLRQIRDQIIQNNGRQLESNLRKADALRWRRKQMVQQLSSEFTWDEESLKRRYVGRLSISTDDKRNALFTRLGGTHYLKEEIVEWCQREGIRLPKEDRSTRVVSKEEEDAFNKWLDGPFEFLSKEQKIALVKLSDSAFSLWEAEQYLPYMERTMRFVDELEMKQVGLSSPLPSKRYLMDSGKPDLRDEPDTENALNSEVVHSLHEDLISLGALSSQERGYEFERFLSALFRASGMIVRNPFRIVGEQIDGSIEFDGNTYLIEAKWQKESVGNAELLVLHGKVGAKATWSRGIFISYSGFSQQGLEAFSRGRPTNLIAVTGEDLHSVLDSRMPLNQMIRLKSRHAAEEGRAFISVAELLSMI